jgi:hypothetical protein
MSCHSPAAIAANPTDEPFLLAARLVPPSYPFTVFSVRYALMGPGTSSAACNTGLPHEVQIFVGDSAAPDASPSVSETLAVPAGQNLKERWLVHSLSSPIRLTSGQALYAGLLVAYDAQNDTSLCPQVCADSGYSGADSFSNHVSSQLPYSWTSFEDAGWPGELTISALGF